ncbi:MAG: hypothetical protein A4E34_01465 [Methanoregula sp. PtaU1.Bin006]|uniref:hypothetical protein n=1 Tax=Methanoregula sp. PtaU1.Bin006 TaxID=1811681 RepID=UPI0009C8C16C|nr:hypothetical protein [Methanoregula sp. PtaU1.Bin006]OPY34420.1 MAG: hypothetical protein A4E34_01465 [Methanoregula sp. PtaU1.Bin006]
MSEKNPIIAALLSIIPGWGQWYNEKNYIKSLIFLVITFSLNFFGITILAIIAWIAGIIEAYMTATKINRNESPFVEVSTIQLIVYFVVAIIVAVILSSLYYILFGAAMFTK